MLVECSSTLNCDIINNTYIIYTCNIRNILFWSNRTRVKHFKNLVWFGSLITGQEILCELVFDKFIERYQNQTRTNSDKFNE